MSAYGSKTERRYRLAMRIGYSLALLLCVLIGTGFVLILQTKNNAFEQAFSTIIPLREAADQSKLTTPSPFPIGVHPAEQRIIENPRVEEYMRTQLTSNHASRNTSSGWLAFLTAELLQFDWYQNLASPLARTLAIRSGERTEQVAQNFGNILGWNRSERTYFRELITNNEPVLAEGKLFASTYVVPAGANPEFVATLVNERFTSEVRARYTDDVAARVPLTDALIIASLIQREAYDFTDMRYISGIIWNRLFIDMPLQLDASLQYAKADQADQPWWPRVIPDDKFIRSPYNTYQNTGLPPGPIAIPSIDAIVATLNPRVTECMYYFHDARGGFHCSKTYPEHVAGIRKYYGPRQ